MLSAALHRTTWRICYWIMSWYHRHLI
jgi:hypothetical protein